MEVNEIYELSKDFRFESAHRLIKGYEGKCSNIHGHSWNGRIVVSTLGLDGFDFAIDFGELKKITSFIESRLDHAILLSNNDLELIDFCKKNNQKYQTFIGNPTSEIIAKWIFIKSIEIFKDEIDSNPFSPFNGVRIQRIEIEETCTSKCVYTNLTKRKDGKTGNS